MKIGILSDIHDNIWNLRAALEGLGEADALICCGDLCSPFVVGLLGEGFPGRWPASNGALSILPAGRTVKAPEVLFRKIEDTQVAEWRERFGGPEA